VRISPARLSSPSALRQLRASAGCGPASPAL
jgi:hypothetical protein